MSESTPQQETAVAVDAVPMRTTPTWEMEMLLSGATVFGLLQLPDALNALAEPLLARLGGGVALIAGILAMYVGAAVYLLLATFISHLIIRGFWIALLGLRSVFPEGPDVTRLRGGPIARDVAQRQLPRVDDEAERLDNLATIAFIFGAISVVGVLMPSVLVLPMLGVAWFWPEAPISQLLLIALGVGLGPMALAVLIDSWFGQHLQRDGRFARLLASVFAGYQRVTQPRFLNVLTVTLMTRLGFGRFMTVYLTILLIVLMGYATHTAMRRDGTALGEYTTIPVGIGSSGAVLPQHYRDQRREADRLRRVPYIDSAIVAGDWLRLIVPHNPTRHATAIKTDCPIVWGSLPLSSTRDEAADTAAQRALLTCYRDISEVRIDGRRIDVLPDIIIVPGSRLRGLQFMMSARDLAPGRHVVQTAMLPESTNEDAGMKPTSYRIPFWK